MNGTMTTYLQDTQQLLHIRPFRLQQLIHNMAAMLKEDTKQDIVNKETVSLDTTIQI